MTKVSRNRLGNVNNKFQGNFRRVLCVCSAGMLRSPTLAEILSQPPYNFNTRAVGINAEFALIPLDVAHIAWANDICVFSQEQYDAVLSKIKDHNENYIVGFSNDVDPMIHIFPVEDDFEFRDPALVKELQRLASINFGDGN